MASYRNKRAGSLLQEEISQLIINGIKDPRVTGFVTVTGVDVTKDLKTATVFVSILGDEKSCKSTLIGLNSAIGYIKKHLSKVLSLKYIPEIQFKRDESIEKAANLYQKILQIENEEAINSELLKHQEDEIDK